MIDIDGERERVSPLPQRQTDEQGEVVHASGGCDGDCVAPAGKSR